MNDPLESLLHELELATLPASLDVAYEDGETAELRTSWQRLSQVLAAVDRERRSEPPTDSRHRKVSRRPAWTVAMSIGSLILAVGVTWVTMDSTTVVHQDEENVAVAPAELIVPNDSQSSDAPPAVELAWDDGLDAQYEAMAESLWQVSTRQSLGESQLRYLQNEMDRLLIDGQTSSL